MEMWLGFIVVNNPTQNRGAKHRPRCKQDSYGNYDKKWLLLYKVRENVEVFDGKFYSLWKK